MECDRQKPSLVPGQISSRSRPSEAFFLWNLYSSSVPFTSCDKPANACGETDLPRFVNLIAEIRVAVRQSLEMVSKKSVNQRMCVAKAQIFVSIQRVVPVQYKARICHLN